MHADVRPVFADVAPALVHEPSGLRVWFTEPPGLVTQITREAHITVDVARFLAGPVTDVLRSLPRKTGQRFVFVHEWTRFRSYEPEARDELTSWAMSLKQEIGMMLFVISKEASSMVRMGIKVGTMTLKLAGIDSELVESIDPALATHGIRPRPGPVSF
ncbi:MAG: hypothetical protein IPK80_10370 [Nannocystis sp.]|jgi:hypothetical protein|nr:hypothetical protein [Nannocystis sp.]